MRGRNYFLFPFDELEEFRERVARFYESLAAHPGNIIFAPRRRWHPPTDIFETKNSVLIRMEIAGLSLDAVRIELDGRVLRIYGKREEMPVLQKRRMYRMEIEYGEFEQFVRFSIPVDRDAIRADYKQGFLTVEVPKQSSKRGKEQKIEIEVLE